MQKLKGCIEETETIICSENEIVLIELETVDFLKRKVKEW